jgi:hypothetical protein
VDPAVLPNEASGDPTAVRPDARGHERDQFSWRDAAAGDDQGLGDLARLLVGTADHGRVGPRGVREQDLLEQWFATATGD